MPMTERLRSAGSGLFSSLPDGVFVQAMTPQSAPPHWTILISAVPSLTRHSPKGDCASAVPPDKQAYYSCSYKAFHCVLQLPLFCLRHIATNVEFLEAEPDCRPLSPVA